MTEEEEAEVALINKNSKKLDFTKFVIQIYFKEYLTKTFIGIQLINPQPDNTYDELIAYVFYHPCNKPVLIIPSGVSLTEDTLRSWILPIMTYFHQSLILADANSRGWESSNSDITVQNVMSVE